MLSEAITLGASADWAMEVGAETDETGGEVAVKAGDCAVTIPAKDSILWDPSLSTAAKDECMFSICCARTTIFLTA